MSEKKTEFSCPSPLCCLQNEIVRFDSEITVRLVLQKCLPTPFGLILLYNQLGQWPVSGEVSL